VLATNSPTIHAKSNLKFNKAYSFGLATVSSL
jgi:hypothetical protein